MANVALVVLDTLRKDAFDEWFDWLPGRRFERAFSTSHWTVPAHGSLFTGRYASEVGVRSRAKHLDCEEPVLAERLSDAGYKTRGFSANANITRRYGFDRGFDEFSGTWKEAPFNRSIVDWHAFSEGGTSFTRIPAAIRASLDSEYDTMASLRYGAMMKLESMGFDVGPDDDGASQVLDLLRNTTFGDDEFFFCNLMEAHSPYAPPQSYRTTDQTGPSGGLPVTLSDDQLDPEPIRQAYDDAVHYLSDVYRDIFEELTGAFDCVVTLSDHGELFGEHGVWKHDYGVYPELVHVPMSVWTGEENVERDHHVVSILDAHRTVLEVAGLDGSGRGQNLLGSVDSREYLTEYHGIGLKAKRDRIYEEFPAEVVERYEQPLDGIATPEDYYGWETIDGFKQRGTSTEADPQERLSELVSTLEKRAIDGREDAVSGSVEQRLKDLGYA